MDEFAHDMIVELVELENAHLTISMSDIDRIVENVENSKWGRELDFAVVRLKMAIVHITKSTLHEW